LDYLFNITVLVNNWEGVTLGWNAVYLRFTQWHLPDPETSSECSRCSRQRFLKVGGFPAAVAGGGGGGARKILPLETLPSPVMAEDMKEELEETLKVSLENSSSTDLALELRSALCGLVKSSVTLPEAWWTGAGDAKSAGRERLAVCGGGRWSGAEGGLWAGARVWMGSGVWTGSGGWTWGWTGARLKRAWPVRLRSEMSFLNLETVTSVRSVFKWEGWWERIRIRCSMPLRPSDAASWMAFWSSILGNPMSSTAIWWWRKRFGIGKLESEITVPCDEKEKGVNAIGRVEEKGKRGYIYIYIYTWKEWKEREGDLVRQTKLEVSWVWTEYN